MASMSSMPFVIDHNAIERPAVFKNRGRYSVPSFAHKPPRKLLTDLTFVCDSGNVECGGRVWMIKATGKNSSGVDRGRGADDVLQVTTEKSAKKSLTQTDVQMTVETTKIFLNERYYTTSHRSNIPDDPVEGETLLPMVNGEAKNETNVELTPYIPSNKDAYNVINEMLEDTSEPILNEADVPAIDDGDVESPPLAGPNVMNVILVAAECAPWSKTGGLGDIAGALVGLNGLLSAYLQPW